MSYSTRIKRKKKHKHTIVICLTDAPTNCSFGLIAQREGDSERDQETKQTIVYFE